LILSIKWEFISIDNLIDLVHNFPLLRANKSFQKSFTKEMKRRLRDDVIESVPRKSYKYKANNKDTQPFLLTLSNALLKQKKDVSIIINTVPI